MLSDSVRIVRQLGAGGMGAVYLGEDLRTHEQVAVKVVLASRLKDEMAMQRFLRESRAAASVSHPAVARTLGVDVSEDGLIFQVQEFVDGEALTKVLEGGRWLSAGEAARVGALLASALSEAHAGGVVHRDLKPSNVMLTPGEPGLKLLDFGIARMAGEASEPQLTGTGQLVGTPDYMAPEQILSPDHVDGKIDVYALGVLLYWVVAGRLPHRSVHLAARPVLDPIPLVAVAAHLPAEMTGLIMACLSREPAGRPTSAFLASELASMADAMGVTSLPRLAAQWLAIAREHPIDAEVTRVKKENRGTAVGVIRDDGDPDVHAATLTQFPPGEATKGDRLRKRAGNAGEQD